METISWSHSLSREFTNNISHLYYEDAIYGTIKFTGYLKDIICTPIFFRLRNLYQTGACHIIFPKMNHTRYEHSIGTSYLAGEMIKWIFENIDNNKLYYYFKDDEQLRFYYACHNNKKIITMVQIAALCHDIGHGPFSHMFDDVILKGIGDHPYAHHEIRSCEILKCLIFSIKGMRENFSDSDIEFMQNLINPNPELHFSWIYQIVSNSVFDIDVDKIDYILRDSQRIGRSVNFDYKNFISDLDVIENKICYNTIHENEIIRLLSTRHDLYKNYYCNPQVIAIQYMYRDIFALIDPILNISKSIDTLESFIKMTDPYVLGILNNYEHSNELQSHPNIINAKKIMNRIQMSDFYEVISAEYTTGPQKAPLHEGYLRHVYKIGYVSGKKKNPLLNVRFHKNGNIKYISPSPMEDPTSYQEYLVVEIKFD